MTVPKFFSFPLINGIIPRWIASPVITTPLTPPLIQMADHVRETGSPFGERGRWAMNFWAFDPEVADLKLRVYRGLPPRDRTTPPPFAERAPNGGAWRSVRAEEDGVIDFSRFNFNPTLMEGWLYATLHSPTTQTITADLLTIGPATLWLNDALVTFNADRFSYVALRRIAVTLDLQAGANQIVIHGEMLGWREARLALGLHFTGAADALEVRLPMLGDDDHSPEDWTAAEATLDAVQIRAFAYDHLPALIWLDDTHPDPVTVDAEVTIPIPDTPWAKLIGLTVPSGRARLTLTPGAPAELPIPPEVMAAFAHLPGENALRLTLRPVNGVPLSREVELWASANAYSHALYGTYDSRLQEARDHLAAMPYDVPASMAAVRTGQALQIDSAAVAVACAFMNDRADCADFYAIGLLAALYWHGDSAALKPEDQAKIEDALRGFKFWIDEPGIDAMCYFTENHQVLFHVTQYLTGQRYPDWVFTNSGLTGREQRALAVPRIEAWIRRRLRGNFSEWDSNAYLTLDAFAMLAIAEFAADASLRALATGLLDKIFYGLAVQTYRGTLGSSHGRCYTVALKSARVENTSPLCRIAFGMGIFNGETRATGLLALARHYRVPEVIQRIGAEVETTVTTRARSVGELVPESDMKAGGWDVRTITYRTPDGMLSAAVDHQPGSMGIQEHLWQATLSPEAAIFTTYPGNAQEHGNARPNFWAGSVRLPRVGMVGRDLICLYRLEAGVGMGFTHVYFPVEAFDETYTYGPWAFVRVGEGYIALWGDGELVWTENGRHAYQELRSAGAGQAWICRLGRRADDGEFADFVDRLLAIEPQITEDGGVTWTTPEGATLAFAWDRPFTVDGVAQSWDDLPHSANAFTDTPLAADALILRHGDETITIDYERGRG